MNTGSSEIEPERGTRWWDRRYLNGDTPWDTGIVPPEIEEIVGSGLLIPGWALDLGCGTGLNGRYLARHGFRVIGLDLALTPLVRGNSAARREARPAYFCLADVTNPPFCRFSASFAVDVGCFHAVPLERRRQYAATLSAFLSPGAYYLLYAFEPWADAERGPAGIGPRDLVDLAPHFSMQWVRHGFDGARPSAWYLFRRF